MEVNFGSSLEAIPERERFDYWRALAREMVGLAIDRSEDTPASFYARGEVRVKGPLRRIASHGDAVCAVRGENQIADQPWGGYVLYRERGDGVTLDFPGVSIVTRPGDLVLYDADAWMRARGFRNYRNDMLVLPRAMLEVPGPMAGTTLAHRLTGMKGVGALASAYLDALDREWDHIIAAEMGQVGDTIGRLLRIALGAPAAEDPDAVRSGRLAALRHHVDRHLRDPHLSPASAAAALHISVRTLHDTLAPTGITFTAMVRQRRLDACRVALLAQPERSVTDIAMAWGFNSLASFYRGFQAAFGISPSDLRAGIRLTLR